MNIPPEKNAKPAALRTNARSPRGFMKALSRHAVGLGEILDLSVKLATHSRSRKMKAQIRIAHGKPMSGPTRVMRILI